MSNIVTGDTVEVLPSNGLRFRKEPNTLSKIIRVLKKGERLEVLDPPYPPADTRYEWLFLKHITNEEGWSAEKSNQTGFVYLEKVLDQDPFEVLAWPTEYLQRPGVYKNPITQHQNANPQNYTKFGLKRGHNGVDLYAPLESRYFAAYPGEVVRIDYSPKGYGWHIRVENGVYTVIYAHASEDIPVDVGDYVEAGDLIGFSGNTGNSSGPHLHIELRDSRALYPSSPFYEGEVWGVVDIEKYITDYYQQSTGTG